jgi:hypothetical protein
VPKPEACGFRLASPIQAAWTGQRDPAVLTVGLDVHRHRAGPGHPGAAGAGRGGVRGRSWAGRLAPLPPRGARSSSAAQEGRRVAAHRPCALFTMMRCCAMRRARLVPGEAADAMFQSEACCGRDRASWPGRMVAGAERWPARATLN